MSNAHEISSNMYDLTFFNAASLGGDDLKGNLRNRNRQGTGPKELGEADLLVLIQQAEHEMKSGGYEVNSSNAKGHLV